jgi:hypothetical protein
VGERVVELGVALGPPAALRGAGPVDGVGPAVVAGGRHSRHVGVGSLKSAELFGQLDSSLAAGRAQVEAAAVEDGPELIDSGGGGAFGGYGAGGDRQVGRAGNQLGVELIGSFLPFAAEGLVALGDGGGVRQALFGAGEVGLKRGQVGVAASGGAGLGGGSPGEFGCGKEGLSLESAGGLVPLLAAAPGGFECSRHRGEPVGGFACSDRGGDCGPASAMAWPWAMRASHS